MSSVRALLAAAVLSLAPVAAAAANWSLTLEPAATEIRFAVGATLHTVEGTARLVKGEIRFDPTTGDAQGRVVVDATSLDSGNARRDRTMHRKVLASQDYAEIVLRPERLEGAVSLVGVGSFLLHAQLELRGTEQTIQLTVDTEVAEPVLRVRASFVVPYRAWGIENPSRLFLRVDDEVHVEIEAAGVLRRAE